MYNSLFNTPDGAEFIGINSDKEFGLEKATKGTPQYDKWLAEYRAKRGKKVEDPEEVKEKAAKILSEGGEYANRKTAKPKEEKEEKPKYSKEDVIKLASSAVESTEDDFVNFMDVVENSDIEDCSPELIAATFNSLGISKPSDEDYENVAEALSHSEVPFGNKEAAIKDAKRDGNKYVGNTKLDSYVRDWVSRYSDVD